MYKASCENTLSCKPRLEKKKKKHKTSQSQTASSLRSKEDISLVESCVWRVHCLTAAIAANGRNILTIRIYFNLHIHGHMAHFYKAVKQKILLDKLLCEAKV